MKLLLDDDIQRIYYNKGMGKDLVVFFPPMSWNRKIAPIWGRTLCEKLMLNALIILPKVASWYAKKEVRTFSEYVKKYKRKDGRVLLYGHSMGAFAAIKYAKLLKAEYVMAFSPQASISPKFCGGYDSRYATHYERGLHDEMHPTSSDVEDSKIYLFFDPDYAPDTFHVNYLSSLSENMKTVSLQYMAHDTVMSVASSTVFARVIGLVKEGVSGEDLSCYLRSSSVSKWPYILNLCKKLVSKNHFTWADRLAQHGLRLANNADDIVREDFNLILLKCNVSRGVSITIHDILAKLKNHSRLNNLAGFLVSCGYYDLAISVYLKIDSLKSNVNYLKGLSIAYHRKGSIDAAREVIESSLLMEPENPHLLAQAAKIRFESGDLDTAITFINKSVVYSNQGSYFVKIRDYMASKVDKCKSSIVL